MASGRPLVGAANEPSQAWLSRRLDGLVPSDFVSSVRFLCTSDLRPPQALGEIWFSLKTPVIAAALANEAFLPFGQDEVILVICDPIDQEQVQIVSHILAAMDRLDEDAPTTLLVPHTMESILGDAGEPAAQTPNIRDLVANIVELGLRDFLVGEPAGFDLALSVRSKIEVMGASRANVFNGIMVRNEFLREAAAVQQRTTRLLWEYLCVRLDTRIPPVDPYLETSRPQLPGFRMGRFLGEGSFGKVYSITGARGDREAVKIVRKKFLRQFNDVMQVNRMINVMNKLREEQWRHPGIAHLQQVYHSPVYLFFRMEFGGRENLLQRLQRRDLEGANRVPMTWTQVQSIVRQTIGVVVHLQTGPGVLHRDINPANFVVLEGPADIQVKLVDFEFAMVHDGKARKNSRCGTLPFIAPEVFLESEADWFAADVWSLGMTLLEVNSEARVFEKVLKLSAADFRQQVAATTLRAVRSAFEKPGSVGAVVAQVCREELVPLLPSLASLLPKMLDTRSNLRIKSCDLQSAFEGEGESA